MSLPRPLVLFLAFCGGAALFATPLLLAAIALGGDPAVAGEPGTSGAESPAASAGPGADLVGSVIPELTPKAELPPAPESEVNVSVAPDVPPASGRTSQAIVEVHFDIVEGMQSIDPATGVEYETWGYRINGGEDVETGTPGPDGAGACR